MSWTAGHRFPSAQSTALVRRKPPQRGDRRLLQAGLLRSIDLIARMLKPIGAWPRRGDGLHAPSSYDSTMPAEFVVAPPVAVPARLVLCGRAGLRGIEVTEPTSCGSRRDRSSRMSDTVGCGGCGSCRLLYCVKPADEQVKGWLR